MAGSGTSLVCCVLLVAAKGLCLCCATELLKGLKGQSLSFPALQLLSHDIVRVTWRTKGTHIAEAKPRVRMFTADFLPEFRGRLLIHPNSLSLEINPLQPSDSGSYEVVVDTLSDPTNPQTFHYSLLVLGSQGVTGWGEGGWSEEKLLFHRKLSFLQLSANPPRPHIRSWEHRGSQGWRGHQREPLVLVKGKKE
ncbi:uncharacterized protein LOC136004086 isoform X2 [Lathamus discolor]|uniref:uncharacterized protein LOC136004086 isoform X2 n=1 Tax=Lathamus discolor TaxID=678569 RepID=UPI0032B726D2